MRTYAQNVFTLNLFLNFFSAYQWKAKKIVKVKYALFTRACVCVCVCVCVTVMCVFVCEEMLVERIDECENT